MNSHLAHMYNTLGAGEAAAEEQTKVASLDLFAKAAAAEQIQLSELSPEDQNNLYSQFCEKLAQEGEEGGEEGGEKKSPFPPKKKEEEEEKDEEKESAARAEFVAQQEWQQKTAEADYLGRQMAHSFWNESGEIQKAAMEKEARGGSSQPGAAEAARFEKKVKGEQAAKAAEGRAAKAEKSLKGAGQGRSGGKQVGGAEGKVREGLRGVTSKVQQLGRTKGGKAALIGGGASLAAGAGYGLHRALKKKEASAFDEQAAFQAMKIAQSAELGDLEEIETKVASLLNLNLLADETEKVAMTSDYDTALNVRGLEFLEAAGQEVDWDEVFS